MPFATIDVVAGRLINQFVTYEPGALQSPVWTLSDAPENSITISGGYGGGLTNSALISGSFPTAGTYDVTVAVADTTPLLVSGVIRFEVAEAVPVITAPVLSPFDLAAEVSIQLLASGAPTSWAASLKPSWLDLDTDTGLLSGQPPAAGSYAVTVAATNATGDSAPLSFTFTVSEHPLYLPWLHADLTLVDLQFSLLPPRAVRSFFMENSAIDFFQSDTATLAVAVDQNGNVDDVTTLWLTGKIMDENAPVIDMTITGSVAKTTVDGSSYYKFALDLDASPVKDAIQDLADNADGTPRVLTLQMQLAVLRSGRKYRSKPFTFKITERIADA